MILYLYRTKDNDEDGNPLDWGAVRAVDDKSAAEFVSKRLNDTYQVGDPLEFCLYPIKDIGEVGIFEDADADLCVHQQKRS